MHAYYIYIYCCYIAFTYRVIKSLNVSFKKKANNNDEKVT